MKLSRLLIQKLQGRFRYDQECGSGIRHVLPALRPTARVPHCEGGLMQHRLLLFDSHQSLLLQAQNIYQLEMEIEAVFQFLGAVCGPRHGCRLHVGSFVDCSPNSDQMLPEIKAKMGDKARLSAEVALTVSQFENCIESHPRTRFQDERRLPRP